MISLKEIPIGTSTRPALLIFPVNANTFVPLEESVPTLANQSPPCLKRPGTFASVSTLLITVGQPNAPLSVGNGGRGFGIPLLPSIEPINAVSSPQTKAPAPFFIFNSRLNPLPRIFSPSKLFSLASFIAFSSLSIASGYSALT